MGGFGAHYKGDVSEVTVGHETGIYLEHNEPFTWTATTPANGDYTEITFAGAGATTSVGSSGILSAPLGMLIGTKLTFHGNNGNYSAFYYEAVSGRIYHVVDHTFDAVTKIKIVPALPNASSLASTTSDVIFIHSLGMPTIQGGTAFTMTSSADTSKEVSAIDQFVGLASFMTLPDTTVDLHRYHVVGLGRQVAVQQTGKVHHLGGSLEMPLHSPKWLYYCLGREVVDRGNCGADPTGHSDKALTVDVAPGQTYIDLDNATFGSITLGVGDYLLINDGTLAPTTTYKAPQLNTNVYWPDGAGLSDDTVHFEWAETSECRRVVAIEPLTTGIRCFVDDPWQFTHTTADTAAVRRYDDADSSGSPHVQANRTIKNPVSRLLYSSDTIPSFCVEHSIRNRDVGSYSVEQSSNTPGGATDSKQLTRVFRGCKIVEWELSSTVDAEVKFRAIFDALSSYTDTGRLESTPGDRYTSHRMFQNTADTLKNRKVAGIADGSEKPFMYYNGTIEAFGKSLGFISGFELRGKTGVELFHTIQSNPVAESIDSSNLSTKQVPFGGTRNASIIREGREEFELEIDVILTDGTLWHELRSHLEKSGVVGTAAGTASPLLHLNFTKPTTTSGTPLTIPGFRVLMDDYIITQAPIPIPDDKGLLHSKIMLQPRNIKVISEDTLYHC